MLEVGKVYEDKAGNPWVVVYYDGDEYLAINEDREPVWFEAEGDSTYSGTLNRKSVNIGIPTVQHEKWVVINPTIGSYKSKKLAEESLERILPSLRDGLVVALLSWEAPE